MLGVAMLTPAARHLISGPVISARPVHSREGYTLQETVDSVFSVIAYTEAARAGRRAALALKVGDTFTGCNPASIAYFGSTPTDDAPFRVRLEHKAFREAYLAALPQVWTGETTRIVLMRRAAARTRGKDKGGYVVLEQTTPGEWKPVRTGSRLMVFPLESSAKDASRYFPPRLMKALKPGLMSR